MIIFAYSSALLINNLVIGGWQDEACNQRQRACRYNPIPVLMVSLDGFRAEYLTRNLTPNIKKIYECGVHTPWMYSTFPTKTFSNHYSIVTGLYPESHGIVDNTFYDPDLDKIFKIGNENSFDSRFWHGEPIWNFVQKHGLKSATYFWPGSEVNISGKYPNYYEKYNASVPFEDRVDSVIRWLHLPNGYAPSFITLYHWEPDHSGHNYGPESNEINNVLQEVDAKIDYLFTQLDKNSFIGCVNVMLLADHGMATSPCEMQIHIDNYLNTTGIQMFGGPVGRLYVKTEDQSVESIADRLTCVNPNFHVFQRSEVPKRWHHASSERIGDLILPSKLHYSVHRSQAPNCIKGSHGYDFRFSSMHTIFMGIGPAFKRKYAMTEPFQNIELYNLLCVLMNLPTCAQNNGTWGAIFDVLKSPPTLEIKAKSQIPNCSNWQSSHHICSQCRIQNAKVQISCGNRFKANFPTFNEHSAQVQRNVCLLSNCEYSLGYDQQIRMPLWTQYAVTHQNRSLFMAPYQPECRVLDQRTDDSECNRTLWKRGAIEMFPLWDFVVENRRSIISHSELYLSSNFVPMFASFYYGMWMDLKQLVNQYAKRFSKLIVTIGPIFDSNHDGIFDDAESIQQNPTRNFFPIPTHYFLIIERCDFGEFDATNKCQGQSKILSFALPNIAQPVNYCQSTNDYLLMHTTKVADVEQLTGWTFFDHYSPMVNAKLRTYINQDLW